MSESIEPLFTAPDRFVCGMDPEKGSLLWTQAARAELEAAAFLDQRFLQGRSIHSESLEQAMVFHARQPAPAGDLRYILHTSFCCSTLLARCLSVPDVSLALKEPSVLADLANWRRRRSPTADPQLKSLLSMTTRLLGKHFHPERTLIKPTNTANNLADSLLTNGPESVFLLLYSELRELLLSVVKHGTRGRSFFRQLFGILRHDVIAIGNTPLEEALRLTDLQMAAAVWHAQMQVFAQFAAAAGERRARTLSSTVFLAHPHETLATVAGFFELPPEVASPAEIERRGLLRRDAKFDDRNYDPQRRAADRRELERRHGAEIDEAVAWLSSATRFTPLAGLPHPLEISDTR